jgi:hypothetical protein
VPGFFAQFVLAAYVPLAALAFFLMRPAKAAIFVVLLGILFLPGVVSFDAPLIPPVGKHEVAMLCALVGMLAFSPRQWRRARLGRGGDAFMLLMIPAIALTVFTNRDPLTFGPLVVPGFTMHDLVALLVRFFFEGGMPYLVGRLVVTSSRDARTLVSTFVGLGLVYSLFMLFEMRMSPNLHYWIYGYHFHSDFSQTVRWGGYRPTVFLAHGLTVGLFALAAALFAATEARITRRRFGLRTGWSTLYLVMILVLCRSTGAIIMGLVTLPVVALASPRRQIRVAVLLAAVCLAYPGVKLAGVFPEQAIREFTRDHLSPERADSLQFRFDNDKRLVDRALERPWFGWGEFGRNRIYDSTGRDTVVTDGYWIIVLCSGGLLRLVCSFGLLLYPVMRAARVLRRVREPGDRFLLAGLAVVVACHVFDLLPNGLGNPLVLFLAGALARLNLELSRPEMTEPQGVAGSGAAFRSFA